MPIIEEDKHYVVLVTLETDPDQQYEFIKKISEQVEQSISRFPGFISASFHASEDGKRVYNYAQWHSKKDYEHFLNEDPDEAREVFDQYIKSMKFDHPLKVIRTIEKL